MAAKKDTDTLDLLAWEPPSLTPSIPEAMIKAPTMKDKIARAVSLVLNECELPREAIAEKMSARLGEDVSVHMLNAYASQAREDHNISAARLVGLSEATGDMRLLQLLAESVGYAVVPQRYVSAIEDAMLTDKIGEFEQRRRLARRRWRT